MTGTDINAYWLKLPLAFPYQLSFATVTEYDSIFLSIRQGKDTFWGEATALPGYSRETASSIWRTVTDCIKKSGGDLELLQKNAAALIRKKPFAASVILTAVEKTLGLVSYDIFSKKDTFPLAGFARGKSPEELALNAADLISCGYDTLKIKLSNNVKHDVKRVKAVQKAAGSGARLRLDANQAYDYEMAVYLLEKLPPDNIELFEQPFARDAWYLVESLVKESHIPVMLDESIWTAEDIEKAGCYGADYVKLKIMKHGGIQNTVRLAEFAREAGLIVILGNGVQTDLGCIDECCVYKSVNLKSAGEMNGFLKLQTPLIPSGIFFKDGLLTVNSGMAGSFSVAGRVIHKKYPGII